MAIRPLLLGHRGTRSTPHIAENTIASFDKAIEHGCDGFEFDVRQTADGFAVICHNATDKRLKIALSSRASVPQLSGLEDIVKRYHQKVFLAIELKVKGLEALILDLLREHPPERDYVVSSLLREVVLELKARNARVPTGIICEKQRHLEGWRDLAVDYVVAQEDLVNQKLIEETHEANVKLLVWTVNNKRSMLKLAKWGVDGIISDDTELLVRTLHKPAPEDGSYIM
ncbi:MAG TPA: glycerophosphodiester phosphodiesterase [Terriglobales bacterium]|nr:glycerophosphodiester phosphodiesterase [Terriglobales bacterium]